MIISGLQLGDSMDLPDNELERYSLPPDEPLDTREESVVGWVLDPEHGSLSNRRPVGGPHG